MNHIATVQNFFGRWNTSYDEMCASFRETFAADAPWLAAPGIPETRGASEAIAVLDQFRAGFNLATVKVVFTRIAQAEDVVWTERVDDIIDAAGNVIVSIPVAGVLELDSDGKIASYRDYWDMQELNSKAVAG